YYLEEPALFSIFFKANQKIKSLNNFIIKFYNLDIKACFEAFLVSCQKRITADPFSFITLITTF
ncbi:hypothetical protein MKJ01_18130, partial [Chryseobacterium sp. SSA4.19]|uniref:hypothetical protein n=1 Tax=Chryseobacterium sp. SSA4.19 TaxID=2919915 RepID=UPI001F4DFB2B